MVATEKIISLLILMLYMNIILVTFPSYSDRQKTSGAIYAGVPTVDFGFECKIEDCIKKNRNYYTLGI